MEFCSREHRRILIHTTIKIQSEEEERKCEREREREWEGEQRREGMRELL